DRLHFVGNVMAESVLRNLPRIESRLVPYTDILGSDGFILTTIHRPENTDHPERLAAIHAALGSAPLPVLIPVHPRTRALLKELAGSGESNVHLIDPIGYLDMLALQRAATAIITDSGGVQEEACMLGTPCVTVRRNTERQVTVEIGANRLVAAEAGAITSGLNEALASGTTWQRPARWDEEVSARVVAALESGVVPLAGL
ncbi:MAG: UDP-N-acetylglucosamine 2-epimerase, partial [Coriobacteriia bacterium]|nr:UDP-N-acetylglucosamine 2-epimerase [Coriobacteriia bacterium]